MGDTFAKAVLFQAPPGPATSSHIIWDERPSGTPEGGVNRPFLWLERPGTLLTIIYFHGNAEDLMDVENDLLEMSDELKVNVLAVEYPGYGLLQEQQSKSSAPWSLATCSKHRKLPDTSQTSVEGIDLAAAHALSYVITTRNIPGSQVILFGRSLGSGTALRLAKYARDKCHWSVGGIVLQSPYISIKQVVSDYACSVGSFLIPTYYDNLTTLRQLCTEVPMAMESKRWVPLLILHGEKDEIVWPYHGHALYEEALKHGHPSAEGSFPGDATHNTWDLKEDIIEPVSQFISKHLTRLGGRNYRGGCFGPSGGRAYGRTFGAGSCVGHRPCLFANTPPKSVGRAITSTGDEERRNI